MWKVKESSFVILKKMKEVEKASFFTKMYKVEKAKLFFFLYKFFRKDVESREGSYILVFMAFDPGLVNSLTPVLFE